MENQLDLNLILKFLVNSEYTKKFPDKKNNENTHLNYLDYCNSSTFKYFHDVLKGHIDRIGIHKNNHYDNSLYFSILYILYKDYCLLDNKDQNYIIKILKTKIKDDLLTRKFKLPRDLVKKKVIYKLKQDANNYLDAYILAIFLNINIYVFSYTDNKIYAFYSENELNTYKKNIFINEIDNIFYPLTYKLDNGRYFKYNSTILNNVIFSDYIYSYNFKNNKILELSNNWENILQNHLNIDTSNIVIDLDSNILINMQDSESSDESDIDYNNLTEEIQNLNNKMNSDNSDNLTLVSSDDDDDDIINDDINNNENMLLIEDIKDYSDYKLKSLKKDMLIKYLELLIDVSDTTRKSTKKNIISNLKNELKKFI
jgi:hypothetical protein